jgi:acetyltransferase
MNSPIKNFFYPQSICIAGASSKEKSIGYELLKNIRDYGYTGKVIPVNPKGGEILGYKCLTQISEIEEPVDLGIVVVPKIYAEETINNLLDIEVKSIILITAGFRETGGEGVRIEKRIVQTVRKAGGRIVGPNCMGAINSLEGSKFNATFVAEKPKSGKTGFLSQSGALGAAVLNSISDTDIRFAHFISVGNKADINENDILDFWEADPNVSAMTFYLESFVDGEGFINRFIDKKIKKPVIVLKAGKTESGMKAALSHTGAMGSEDKAADSVLKQFGVIRAESVNEMFNTAKGFEYFPIPKGNRVAVLTNAGGPAILAVDAIEKEGLKLAKLTNETKLSLREIVHSEASVHNPVDVLPAADAETYKRCAELLLADENVDAVVSIFVEPVMVSPRDVVRGINEIESDKPAFQVVMPLPKFWTEYHDRPENIKPVFRNPEDPAEVIANMLFYKKSREAKTTGRLAKREAPAVKLKTGELPQEEALELAKECGLPIVDSQLLKYNELNKVTGFPLVIKAVGEKLTHKSDLNALRLNIKNRYELKNAADELKIDLKKKGYKIDKFLLQPYVKIKHEVLLGGVRDSSFGPAIMFGTGGIYTEVYKDVVMRSAYLTDADIEQMISSSAMGKILKGARGQEAADISKLKAAIKAAAQMMIDYPSIAEFDINPLAYTADGDFFAVDIRIRAK